MTLKKWKFGVGNLTALWERSKKLYTSGPTNQLWTEMGDDTNFQIHMSWFMTSLSSKVKSCDFADEGYSDNSWEFQDAILRAVIKCVN